METLKKFKIAFVMPWHISERGGGAEVQANYLAQELASRQFDVTYICQTTDISKIGKTSLINNLKVIWLKPSGKFPWLDQNKYLKVIETLNLDFIVQRLSSNVSYVLGKYSKSSSCKFIWICTDNKSPFRDFHVQKFRASISEKKIGFLKRSIFYLNSKIMDYYRNKGMQNVDVAFTQNNFQKETLSKEFKMTSNTMISGHERPANSLSTQERLTKKTILWCGNLGKNKRPEIFIELAKRFTNEDFRFIIVGDHSDSKYKQSLFKEKSSNLEVIGQVSFKESLKYFDNATVLINTSVSEGFSNSYIQSWMRGIPTIVFGADPDGIIYNNKLGCNVKNINEAENKVRELLEDFKLYSKLSNIASIYAYNNHSITKMTDHFINTILE